MTDTPADPRSQRRQAVSDLKRQMILDAAERIFQQDGLDGAHMRAIAREAGYTVSALYKYYASKEEIYADLLAASLDRLHAAVEGATPADAAMSALRAELRCRAARRRGLRSWMRSTRASISVSTWVGRMPGVTSSLGASPVSRR